MTDKLIELAGPNLSDLPRTYREIHLRALDKRCAFFRRHDASLRAIAQEKKDG